MSPRQRRNRKQRNRALTGDRARAVKVFQDWVAEYAPNPATLSQALLELDPWTTAAFLAEWLHSPAHSRRLPGDARKQDWLWRVIEAVWHAPASDSLSAFRAESMRWIALNTMARYKPGLTFGESDWLYALANSLSRSKKDSGGPTRELYHALVDAYWTTSSVSEATQRFGGWLYVFTSAADEDFKVGAHESADKLVAQAWKWREDLPPTAKSAKVIVHIATLSAAIAGYMNDDVARERTAIALDRLNEASDVISEQERIDGLGAVEHLRIALNRGNLLRQMSLWGLKPYLVSAGERRDALLEGLERYRKLTPTMPPLSDDAMVPLDVPHASELAQLLQHLADASVRSGDWELCRDSFTMLQRIEVDGLQKWDHALAIAWGHPDRLERQRHMEHVLRIAHHYSGGSTHQRSRLFRRSAGAARHLSRSLDREKLRTSAAFWSSMSTEWASKGNELQRKAKAIRANRASPEKVIRDTSSGLDTSPAPPVPQFASDSNPSNHDWIKPKGVNSLCERVAAGRPDHLILEMLTTGRYMSSLDACVDLNGISKAVDAVESWDVPKGAPLDKPTPSDSEDKVGAQLWMLYSAAELAAVFAPHLLPEIYSAISRSPYIDMQTKLAHARISAEHAKVQNRPNMLSSALFDAARFAIHLQDPLRLAAQIDALIAALEDTALWTTGGSDLIETASWAGRRSEKLIVMLLKAGFVDDAARLFDASQGWLESTLALRPEYAAELQLMETAVFFRSKADTSDLFARIRSRILSTTPLSTTSNTQLAPRSRLARPRRDEALIRLIPDEEGSWALVTRTKDSGEHHEAVELPFGSARIAELSEKIWIELRPSRLGRKVSTLDDLHRIVVEPIIPIIADAQVLLIIPQGVMSSLPVHAARGPAGYLVEHHAVAYFPTETHIDSKSPGKLQPEGAASSLVCGWDISAQADIESLDVARTLRRRNVDVERPANARTGKSRLLATGHRLSWLHVSGHGSSEAWPRSFDSQLALSRSVIVSAAEWITDGPQADFVFFNVCGIGRVHARGGDLNGFPLAVRIRGATALIAATGYIPPKQAHDFARLFYDQAHTTDSLTAYCETICASIRNGVPPHGWAPYAHFGRGHHAPTATRPPRHRREPASNLDAPIPS